MNFDENASQFEFLSMIDGFTLVIAFVFFGSISDIQHLVGDLLFHAAYPAFVDGQFASSYTSALDLEK